MLCSYMCIEAGVRAYSAGYSLLPCNKFNHSDPPIAFILYVFYISKILDFLDTFFIIAEKRWKQLRFLHVYHHFSIFLVSSIIYDWILTLLQKHGIFCTECHWLMKEIWQQWFKTNFIPLFCVSVLLVEFECWLWRRCVRHHSSQRAHSHSNVYLLLRLASYERYLVEVSPHYVSDGAVRFDERPGYVPYFHKMYRISKEYHNSIRLLHSHSPTTIRPFLRDFLRHRWKQKEEILWGKKRGVNLKKDVQGILIRQEETCGNIDRLSRRNNSAAFGVFLKISHCFYTTEWDSIVLSN